MNNGQLKRYYVNLDSEHNNIEGYHLLLSQDEVDEVMDDLYKLKEKYRKRGLEI